MMFGWLLFVSVWRGGGIVVSYRASVKCRLLTEFFPVGREVSITNYHRNLPKHDTDARLVYEYLRDYPQGLTVCEFLEKLLGGLGKEHLSEKLFIRYRPRFTDLCSKELVTKTGVVCSVCQKKETNYRIT
jgi:hypothetical protein